MSQQRIQFSVSPFSARVNIWSSKCSFDNIYYGNRKDIKGVGRVQVIQYLHSRAILEAELDLLCEKGVKIENTLFWV